MLDSHRRRCNLERRHGIARSLSAVGGAKGNPKSSESAKRSAADLAPSIASRTQAISAISPSPVACRKPLTGNATGVPAMEICTGSGWINHFRADPLIDAEACETSARDGERGQLSRGQASRSTFTSLGGPHPRLGRRASAGSQRYAWAGSTVAVAREAAASTETAGGLRI